MKGYAIYVQNDLLERKHYEAIGPAIWLYLWCLDKMTSITEDGVGLVLGGKPIKFKEIEDDIGMSDRSYTRYVRRLEEYGYLIVTRTPYGYILRVTKAKKVFGKRSAKVAGRSAKVATQIRQSGGNKEDKTVDKPKDNTLSEQSSQGALKDKKDDMSGFNRVGDDYEEGYVDIEGSTSLIGEKKKSTAKYPNAPAVRKLFLEILGKNPADWKTNKTILQACENLYTERGLDKIRNALEFYADHKDEQFCPKIHSPVDLDRKYGKLAEYKLSK